MSGPISSRSELLALAERCRSRALLDADWPVIERLVLDEVKRIPQPPTEQDKLRWLWRQERERIIERAGFKGGWNPRSFNPSHPEYVPPIAELNALDERLECALSALAARSADQ